MDFFATGAFQQLYSELAEDNLNCCYADVDMSFEPTTNSMDYYDIITLDSNNNHNSSEINNNNNNNFIIQDEHGLYFDFDQELTHYSSTSTASSSASPPDLSDWEQRLLDNYVEIPELIDFLPERTPLCTDMCDSFLQESNNNLRLAAPTSLVAPDTSQMEAAMSSQSVACSESVNLQLGVSAAGERGYLCTFGNCEKLYAKPAHLKAHLRRHLGEKPYACSWPDCQWRFSRSDELARHRRSHSGIKPYKCDYCTKCFARSDHLTKHRKVHERRLLAASRSGKMLPDDVYSVRPGRKRKNQI